MASADLSRINTNIAALNALNALNSVNTRISVHSLRLATGKRINSAADDAAGFTIASKLKVKSEGLGTALDNIGSAKNLMTVAEGHLTNIQEILTGMKSKAQQAANGTLGSDERAAILSELQEFNNQIDSEIEQAKWAGVPILGTGSISDLTFQIGVGTASSDELSFNVADNTWTTGTNTTFNSAGLNVVASGSVVKAAATAGFTGASGLSSAVFAVGTSSTINGTYGAELAAGTYTLEISTTHGGSGAASSVTIRLKDSGGNYLSIDQDGTVAGAGDYGTSISYSLSGGAGATNGNAVDLGVGITIDLDNIATGSDGTATATITYTQAGNSVSTQALSQDFMDNVDAAINKVSEGLSYIGSMINRLSFQEESLTVAKVNSEAAYSRIVDADMAFEQLETTKLMILQQTATAMLAQANVAPQTVLALFG
jgi:flagellin